jgi:hypothetical protein
MGAGTLFDLFEGRRMPKPSAKPAQTKPADSHIRVVREVWAKTTSKSPSTPDSSAESKAAVFTYDVAA